MTMKKVNWWGLILEVIRVIVAALAGAGGASVM